ncbi:MULTISPECIES: FG-GAP repeat domain-containing protein [Streptomyces]|uniref:FG-GAP repeat domain-containing protein n=1 Tax=Streptomyces TaxID=1883 RepID=UPI001F622C51|nr:VCBS repeat-containing protein [Streptomyces griseocarneus]
MTQSSRRERTLSRLVTSAIAVTLVGAAAGTAVADAPAASGAKKSIARSAAAAGQNKPTPAAPFYFLSGILPSGQMYAYMPNGKGGFEERSGAYMWQHFKFGVPIDLKLTGYQDGAYHVMDDGTLNLWLDGKLTKVATGWGGYDTVFSPGTLGGSAHPDLLARDKQGVLWRYRTKTDGSLEPRAEVGPGWNQYTQITGLGDLSGDGKSDIVARDKQGVLWLYKGTGDLRKPFAPKVKVGPAWNQFNKLVATGDVDGDGHSDLLARNPKGDLYLYKGTGKAASPFKPKAKIGTGFDQYRDLF